MQMARSKMPLISPGSEAAISIEFFGLPGSGKTTLARAVHAILSQTNPEFIFAPDLVRDDAGTFVRATAKLRLILAGLVNGGGSGTNVIRNAVRVGQPRLRDKMRAVFTVATVSSLYAHLARRRVNAVLDQGLLQALWTVQLRAPASSTPLSTEIITDAARSGRIYVSVEVPAKVCAQRLNSRVSKHSRMQASGAGEDNQAWASADLLRRRILRDLKAAYRKHNISPRIVRVDGTAQPDELAQRIVSQILPANPLESPVDFRPVRS